MSKTLGFSLVFLLLIALGTLSASPVNCTPTPPVTVATVTNFFTTPPTGSPTISCGPLTFSNFQAVSADNGASLGLPFNYVSPSTWDASTGTVLLTFNPNFSVPISGNIEDIHLFFDVTAAANSSIVGVDGAIGGTNSHFTEFVCSGAGGYSGGGGCSTATLAMFTLFSGQNQNVISITPSGSVGIYKNIQTIGPGALTGFDQTFQVTTGRTVVPEPGTLMMLGSVVLGLAGLMRRKLV